MPRNRHGGQRTPEEPAPVSGPGALSRRTDGGPGNPAPPMTDAGATHHGEGVDVQNIQQAGAGLDAAGPDPGPQDPFATPTDHPEQPTFGGGQPAPPPDPHEMYKESDQYIDMMTVAPMLPVLEAIADRPGASSTLRNTVRRLRSMVPQEFDYSEVFDTVQELAAAAEREPVEEGAAVAPEELD